ncbi:hypothetical protein HYH03_010194 [Edaphochlamys debaryana]|uniref:Uncharacterized protein n=1 Tax=Edaphochlamys debaryana TaxID=47281 RepID=A0A835XWB3_9CHLO|nr:hypothetical protein HYH03_010194 [Edaphochlamys debaryana]|eukprot:KAG2491403.1 hypothetical protein HYH03_010194 [Edaphochlamys debaryana]
MDADDPVDGKDTALDTLARVWSGWDAKQKAYAVVAAGVLLLVGPQLLTVLLIPLERLLVGSLLLLEEAIALFLLQGARVLGLMAAVALLGAGVYLFVFRRQPEK